MARRNRKRGRNSRNEVPGNINININIPSTSTTADEAEVSTNPVTQTTNQETSIRRQGGGRPNYHVEEPKTDLGPSPERLSSRFSNPSNGCGDTVEFNISNARHAAEVAQGTVEAVKVVPPMDAVVKVICAHAEPNFSLPWQRKHQPSSTSSGFIIKNQRVLTNAHSVEHYTQVKLKKRGSDTKYLATVLAIGTECDIAMLTVRDDEFWEGVSPVEFGDLPTLLDAVTVVGYPIGGETISVTSGVVSRIEMVSYVHGSAELLGLQIDAAINSGNSGGPAFSDKGKCVGIAFQSLGSEDVENISYLISTPVIKHFLQDYEKNEEYTGFPVLAVEWQPMENPDLRKLMGMEPDQKGVLIRRVEPTGPQSRDLKPLDVILSFDGVNIANDGTVRFGNGECISFSYLVSQKYIGDNAVVKILRNSDTLELDTELGNHTRLIPANIKGDPPYYIIGGFVFTAVSVPYLCSKYGKDFDSNAPAGLMDKHLRGMAQSKDEEVVVVSQVLDADVNIGYAGIVNTQVIAFNGKPVKNLKTLAGMVETCNEEFLKFVLDYDQIVVLQTQKAKEATGDILATYSIPSAMSNDLMPGDENGGEA